MKRILLTAALVAAVATAALAQVKLTPKLQDRKSVV